MCSPDLLRGDGWILCCICFVRHEAPYPDLYRDAAGDLWDMCRPCGEGPQGLCAREALHDIANREA